MRISKKQLKGDSHCVLQSRRQIVPDSLKTVAGDVPALWPKLVSVRLTRIVQVSLGYPVIPQTTTHQNLSPYRINPVAPKICPGGFVWGGNILESVYPGLGERPVRVLMRYAMICKRWKLKLRRAESSLLEHWAHAKTTSVVWWSELTRLYSVTDALVYLCVPRLSCLLYKVLQLLLACLWFCNIIIRLIAIQFQCSFIIAINN